jgi:hypothetical protein
VHRVAIHRGDFALRVTGEGLAYGGGGVAVGIVDLAENLVVGVIAESSLAMRRPFQKRAILGFPCAEDSRGAVRVLL